MTDSSLSPGVRAYDFARDLNRSAAGAQRARGRASGS